LCNSFIEPNSNSGRVREQDRVPASVIFHFSESLHLKEGSDDVVWDKLCVAELEGY